MDSQKILDQVQQDFYGRIPSDALAIIDRMAAAKSLGNKTLDKIQAEFWFCTDGFFFAVKKAITEQRALDNCRSNPAEARIDRILRIRDSSGKARARK